MASQSMKKSLFRFLKLLIVAIILYFIFRQILTQWDQVRNYQWRINWILLISSLLTLQLGLFVKSWLWSQVLRCFGQTLPAMRAFRVAYLSNLGRYVPGKVMQFVGIMYLAKKEGIREDAAVSSFALVQLFDTPSGLILIFLYYLILGTSMEQIRQYLPVLIILGVLTLVSFLIILIPSLMERMLNLILKLFKQPRLEFELKKKTGIWLLILYFIDWNIIGAAFYLFLRAITDVPVEFFLQACLVYVAAYLIGYWALFAPGGIGVREGAMSVFLAQIGGLLQPVAYAVSLAARLWFMVGEILVSILALMVRKKD